VVCFLFLFLYFFHLLPPPRLTRTHAQELGTGPSDQCKVQCLVQWRGSGVQVTTFVF
jgi:hypothetical protein